MSKKSNSLRKKIAQQKENRNKGIKNDWSKNQLIKYRQRNISNVLKCPICYDILSHPSCPPCMHTFCLKCIKNQKSCPMCRAPINNQQEIKTNFKLQEIMKELIVDCLHVKCGWKGKKKDLENSHMNSCNLAQKHIINVEIVNCKEIQIGQSSKCGEVSELSCHDCEDSEEISNSVSNSIYENNTSQSEIYSEIQDYSDDDNIDDNQGEKLNRENNKKLKQKISQIQSGNKPQQSESSNKDLRFSNKQQNQNGFSELARMCEILQQQSKKIIIIDKEDNQLQRIERIQTVQKKIIINLEENDQESPIPQQIRRFNPPNSSHHDRNRAEQSHQQYQIRIDQNPQNSDLFRTIRREGPINMNQQIPLQRQQQFPQQYVLEEMRQSPQQQLNYPRPLQLLNENNNSSLPQNPHLQHSQLHNNYHNHLYHQQINRGPHIQYGAPQPFNPSHSLFNR